MSRSFLLFSLSKTRKVCVCVRCVCAHPAICLPAIFPAPSLSTRDLFSISFSLFSSKKAHAPIDVRDDFKLIARWRRRRRPCPFATFFVFQREVFRKRV